MASSADTARCAAASVSRASAQGRACQRGAALSHRHACWSMASSSNARASARGTFGSSAARVHASSRFLPARARLNWLYRAGAVTGHSRAP
jgi:hypothetical protein